MAHTDTLTLRAQAEAIASLYPVQPGRPGLIADPNTVTIFLAAIADGNYIETACKLTGISKQAYYNTVKRAEAGEPSAMAFVDAVQKAEATAESEIVRNVKAASKLPQFWAAGMTLLERKSPEKWGKRQDDNSSPKVIVQIGVQSGDVQVRIGESPTISALPLESLNDSSIG